MQNTVYKNASIVTGLSIAERALGFLYRIVLSRYIGAEGVGLYHVALSLLSLFSTLSTGGLPITISRMIAKSDAKGEGKEGSEVLSAGLVLGLALSLPLSLLLAIFSDKLPFLFSDERSIPVFQILLLGLSFSAVYAVIRGYFWGKKQFLTASLLEMTEEIVMVLAGLFFLQRVRTPLQGARSAAWALAAADILSCLAAIVAFLLAGGQLGKPKNRLKLLFNATMPITFVRMGGSFVNSAVAVLLPAMLIKTGIDEGEAIGLFGVLSGMVIPVLFTPATLIGSLSLVLVPELSADYYKKSYLRLRKNIGRGLRFSFLVACALIPLFYVLGKDIGLIAFSEPKAGALISKGCWVLLPMSLTMISTSMLNSIGFEKKTFAFFFLGAAALFACILFLPPYLGAYSYVVGLGASYMVTAACNLIFLQKQCPISEKERGQVCVELILPTLCAMLLVTLLGNLLANLCRKAFGQFLSLLLPALAMGIICALLYFLLFRVKKKEKQSIF